VTDVVSRPLPLPPREVLPIAISVSVCLSVRSHFSKTSCPNFTKFVLPVAVARSSDDNAIRFVFPVMWMTSCFHIIGILWCTVWLTAEG